jgi:hypothetical protein
VWYLSTVVSGQPIGHIFKRQEIQQESFLLGLLDHSTLRNIPEERRTKKQTRFHLGLISPTVLLTGPQILVSR